MELWKLFGFSNYLQNKQIKDQLSADSNKPKCPHCGGPAEPGYSRCKNCGQKIDWDKVREKNKRRQRKAKIQQAKAEEAARPYYLGFSIVVTAIGIGAIIYLVSAKIGQDREASYYAEQQSIFNWKEKCDDDCSMLLRALRSYYSDVGHFPDPDFGFKGLRVAPTDAKQRDKWRGPYMETEIPTDPWGNAYIYERRSLREVFVISGGPDGIAGFGRVPLEDQQFRHDDTVVTILIRLVRRSHGYNVYSAAFSPDEKRIVSGSSDKTIKIWDGNSGEEQQTLKGHSDSVRSVAFSPDGKRIVSGSRDTTIKIWDASTGKDQQTLTGHTLSVYSVAFSPDGKRIVSGSGDKTIKIWDGNSGEEQQTLKGHSGSVRSVALSPDGKQIVSGSEDTTLKIWEAETGQETFTLKDHSDSVLSVAFSPDGKRIVSGSGDKTIKIWDASTGAVLQTLTGHTDDVTSVAFSPNGKRIVSGSGRDDGTIKIWDANIGLGLQSFTEYDSDVYSVAFSPDGKRIVSGRGEGGLHIWYASE